MEPSEIADRMEMKIKKGPTSHGPHQGTKQEPRVRGSHRDRKKEPSSVFHRKVQTVSRLDQVHHSYRSVLKLKLLVFSLSWLE